MTNLTPGGGVELTDATDEALGTYEPPADPMFPFALGARITKDGDARVMVVRSYLWGGLPGNRILIMVVGYEPDDGHEFPIGFKIPRTQFDEWSEVGS
ncbi:hypothetical protein SEA_VANLEE_139 [Gordonia phage VanLee]|uniref:Uncharacterized protein n=1 Tax=Gordonia phage VanLee TaxID=2845816 RepID=A0A8F2DA95_9CAUD|nr:hypothetical protein QEH49_gp151 [Gordonia phage VanLee]QWS68255.1 hypothetical protein SEA_VANLEE_139 [Gordonia phage VanLee]